MKHEERMLQATIDQMKKFAETGDKEDYAKVQFLKKAEPILARAIFNKCKLDINYSPKEGDEHILECNAKLTLPEETYFLVKEFIDPEAVFPKLKPVSRKWWEFWK